MTKNVPCIFERLFPGQRCSIHSKQKKTRTVKSSTKTKKVA